MEPTRITEGFGSLRPGELIDVEPKPGWGAISGQVVAASATSAIVVAPPTQTFPNGLVDTIEFANVASVTRRGSAPLQSTIIKTYKGKQQADAARSFERDANVLSSAGYEVASQSWAAGQWGAGAFLGALVLAFVLVGLLIFLYLLVVKPEGTLTVTYGRRASAPSAETEGDTKVCPRCAETIKAAALVCRFCGQEFGPAQSRPD